VESIVVTTTEFGPGLANHFVEIDKCGCVYADDGFGGFSSFAVYVTEAANFRDVS
jgi:hypothetical protein